MISVEEALDFLLDNARGLDTEYVSLGRLSGRVCAETVHALTTQPPFPASAMDGYAIRFEDAQQGNALKVIGEAPAGKSYAGCLKKSEAVRIFTGAMIPAGADHVVIQEDVERQGADIIIREKQHQQRHIRAAGIDMQKGDILAEPGTTLHHLHGSVFAAANIPHICVYKKPRIALFSTGDELIDPGSDLEPGKIVNSNHYALTALIDHWGGIGTYLGCARDTEDDIAILYEQGRHHDVIVPVGGASVGDYDHVRSTFTQLGGNINFSKVAVKPGKPTWYGALDRTNVLGLPGNPASAIVTACLFLQPLIRALAGQTVPERKWHIGKLATDLPANGRRENYLRAVTETDRSGNILLHPAEGQDSSLLKPFLSCNALIRRKPNSEKLQAGALTEFMTLTRSS
ncbi:gephyrin-like molybdotransferase Glp [Parvularcula sp. IMCC14364]|uniref:molybdopterin molybdotransferase MoeA n=1 Tax=Parvularcula sp. IMCC14364 TaxID=3067902 RepID=UPI002741CE18|nr:gephyrin-like molybdotransferase Glp [Parvularcula sp. IMCC14364]